MEIDKVEVHEFLEPFFYMKEHQILDNFAALSKNSASFGEGDYRSVFVPGTRKDRVLLVAHVDTVLQDSPHIKVAYKNGLMFSEIKYRGLSEGSKKNKAGAGFPRIGGMAIGADDRVGVAILYLLRNLGHSLLLTNCEECGCLGSMALMSDNDNAEMINDHNFAVQFDRAGRNDLVFYDVGSDEFVEYCEKETGFKFAEGTYTDIRVLCEKMCGVNISVGYKNEHTCNEVLNTRWWERTARTAYNWLSKDNLGKRFTH